MRVVVGKKHSIGRQKYWPNAICASREIRSFINIYSLVYFLSAHPKIERTKEHIYIYTVTFAKSLRRPVVGNRSVPN